jgi:hypothetical protein
MTATRASIVTNWILSVIYRTGLGEEARAEIRQRLQDEFDSIASDAVSEFRLHPFGEDE